MNDRTPGTRDLQSQDEPLPGKTREITRLNARISQSPNISSGHVGSGPPNPHIDHIKEKIHKKMKNFFHFHIDNRQYIKEHKTRPQLSLSKGEPMHHTLVTLYTVLSAIVPTGFRKGAIFVPILGNLRGSVGANTFSHNRGGDYIRRRVPPTNPNSTRQQTMRSLLSSLASQWSSLLTVNQRAAWNTWAGQQPKEGPLGNSINLSGINGFIWANTHVLDASDPILTDPPVEVAPDAFLTLAADVSAILTADLTFTPTPLAADERGVLFMSLPQSGEAEPNFKQCRIVGYSALAQASPWAATLPFPVLVDQKVIFFLARYSNLTGLFSQFLRAVDTADYV